MKLSFSDTKIFVIYCYAPICFYFPCRVFILYSVSGFLCIPHPFSAFDVAATSTTLPTSCVFDYYVCYINYCSLIYDLVVIEHCRQLHTMSYNVIQCQLWSSLALRLYSKLRGYIRDLSLWHSLSPALSVAVF